MFQVALESNTGILVCVFNDFFFRTDLTTVDIEAIYSHIVYWKKRFTTSCMILMWLNDLNLNVKI